MKNFLTESFTVQLPKGADPLLLEDYLLENSTLFFSKKSLRKAFKEQNVLVARQPVDRFHSVATGDTVEIRKEEPPPGPVFELPLRMIYEDSWCAVVEKVPGYRVNGNLFQTIENALPFNLEPSSQKGALSKPRPVHRLDKPTGGLLLVAKTSEAMIGLSRQFQGGEVYKAYEALVCGKPGPRGIIASPVDGRDAETEYFTLRTVPSLKNGFLTWVKLFPKKGRKHQLRRHCAELGTPILGDTGYGEEGKVLRGKGLFLWSVSLSFRHPEFGYTVALSIKAPAKFDAMMHREQRRWKKYN